MQLLSPRGFSILSPPVCGSRHSVSWSFSYSTVMTVSWSRHGRPTVHDETRPLGELKFHYPNIVVELSFTATLALQYVIWGGVCPKICVASPCHTQSHSIRHDIGCLVQRDTTRPFFSSAQLFPVDLASC